jgi:hypothetical protein
MVVVEVVGALLGTVCHHCQRLHLWVLQERAPLGWRGVVEGSGSVLHREAEELGQVEAHKETGHKEMDTVTLVVFHKEIGVENGYVVVPESQNVRVAAPVARSVHAEVAFPSRMGSAAPCLAGPYPSPSAFPSCHTG